MSEPTADEIARWAERHVDGDGECWTCEQPWPCEPSRLLALVAAQAEELHALHATDDYQRWARAVAERDAAREELRAAGVRFEKVLAEQDAQLQKALAERREALAERDAARKQVRRVRVVIDEMAAKREYSALLFAWANELREALDPEPPR